jgi:hypothetical protein
LKPTIAAHMALANALSGSLDTARTWRTEAEARLQRTPEATGVDATIAFTTAVIDVREGRPDEFLETFDARRPKLEMVLTARMMRALGVLRAFALARRNGTDDDEARRAFEAANPRGDAEFMLLEAGWPEMRAFLHAPRT